MNYIGKEYKIIFNKLLEKNKIKQLEMDSTDSELWENPYKAREITTTLAHLSEEVLQCYDE